MSRQSATKVMSTSAVRTSRSQLCSAPAGFTLLEVLVATAVAAVLVALLAQMVDGLRRARASTVAAWSAGAGVMIDADVIASLLRNALPVPGNRPELAFVGRNNELRFSAAAPQAWREAGTVRVVMKVEQDRVDAVRIVVELSALTGSQSQVPSRHVLMSHLKAASFAFAERSASATVAEWTDKSRLPGLIRLDASPLDPGAAPISVLAAPRRQRVASCALDLISLECRYEG